LGGKNQKWKALRKVKKDTEETVYVELFQREVSGGVIDTKARERRGEETLKVGGVETAPSKKQREKKVQTSTGIWKDTGE